MHQSCPVPPWRESAPSQRPRASASARAGLLPLSGSSQPPRSRQSRLVGSALSSYCSQVILLECSSGGDIPPLPQPHGLALQTSVKAFVLHHQPSLSGHSPAPAQRLPWPRGLTYCNTLTSLPLPGIPIPATSCPTGSRAARQIPLVSPLLRESVPTLPRLL